ncbi:hypothetical protein PCE1_002083 [Barthelona sp. PCE]
MSRNRRNSIIDASFSQRSTVSTTSMVSVDQEMIQRMEMLEKRVQSYNSEKNSLYKRIDDQEEIVKGYRSKINDFEKYVDAFITLTLELQSRMAHNKGEEILHINQYRERERLKQQDFLATLDVFKWDFRTFVGTLEQKNEELTKQLVVKDTDIRRLQEEEQKEIQEIKGRNQVDSKRVMTLAQQNEEQAKEILALQTANDELHGKYEKLVQDYSSREDDLRTERKMLENRIRRLESDLKIVDIKDQRIHKLQRHIEELGSEHQQNLQRAEVSKTNTINKFQRELRNAVQVELENKGLLKMLHDKEQELRSLQRHVNVVAMKNAQAEAKKLKNLLREKNVRIDEIEKHNRRLVQLNNDLNARINRIKEHAHVEKSTAVRSEKQGLQNELKALLSKNDNDSRELKNTIRQLRSERKSSVFRGKD